MIIKDEKYSQILDYLLEYTKNRTTPVRDIYSDETEYPEIILFADMPDDNNFDCIINKSEDEISDTWIKISKPKELRPPKFPELNDVLELWADKDSLMDEKKQQRLKPSIFVNGKTIYSTSYPQISEEFKQYLDTKWYEDFDTYKAHYAAYENKIAEHDRLQKLYQLLFDIYQKIDDSDEDYELVVGAGLLKFKKDDDSPMICRHILTTKVDITYDPLQKDPVIEVLPDVESVVQIETDALKDIFDEDDILEAEKTIYEFIQEKNVINNLFRKEIKEALELFADKIHTDATFMSGEAKFKESPVIYFSPTLMLRKRNEGGVTALYDRIVKYINNIEEDENVPLLVDEEEDNEQDTTYPENNEKANLSAYNNDNIFSPANTDDAGKPALDNQIKIDNRADLLSMNEFLVFTSLFNVYKVQNKGIKTKMEVLENIVFEAGEKPVYLTGTKNYSGYLIVAYQNGKIGKITMESYQTEFNRKKLKNAFNDESKLVFIEHVQEDIDLVAVSSINKVILFNTKQINPVGSKTTKGFQVMKSKDGSLMTKIKKTDHVRFQDPSYYRKEEGLNAVGFYLKQGDAIL